MIIDLVFVVLVVLALFHGYRRGLIVGVFSLVAIIIGLAAAIKFSTLVAGWLGKTVKISEQWLPLISFALVFLAVLFLIRLGANAIEKLVQTMMLGWANKLGGMILYLAIYTTVYSILLFYAVKMNWIQPATINRSATYSYLQPWGPKVIDGFGRLLPVFRDMFHDLEDFFDRAAKQANP